MDAIQKAAARTKAKTILRNLSMRNMNGFYFETSTEAGDFLISQIPEGLTVGWGHSVTLDQLGVKTYFREHNYTVFDRDSVANDLEARKQVLRACLSCDAYLVSANAITMKGEIVNIDGRGNRCAAMCFGPEKVYIVVGINKVTTDLDSAIQRIRTETCVPNAIAHHVKTPCAITGQCTDCLCSDCICCQILVTRFAREKGRYTILLIGEDLGY